jgi:protein-disulfide isomerase
MTNTTLLFGLAAMASWGVWALLAEVATDYVDPVSAMIFSYAASVGVALAYVVSRGDSLSTARTGVGIALVAGVFAGIGAVAFYSGLERGRTSIVTTALLRRHGGTRRGRARRVRRGDRRRWHRVRRARGDVSGAVTRVRSPRNSAGVSCRVRSEIRRMQRRKFLALTAGGIAGLSGCLGGDSGSDEDRSEHPATRNLDAQPSLGPDPADADNLLVAFGDPSCPTCRRFETRTFPRIRSELVDSGDAAYVFRGYPDTYEWGEPAVHALEATFDRDEAAFWSLKAHVYETQSAFGTDNVLDRVESFLADETGLDAAAVVADARDGTYDDAIHGDVEAAEGSDASTPSVAVFSGDEFRSLVSGAQDFEVYESALDA